ncbi:MAG: hypothetical protein OSB37_00150 [Acidimicrobiales bacterium]|nr:hypothetical protein [Acidimicrobiales bacterium]|tara:strand:+ start:8527 stop:8766 length:240 start_codon:yes stop_codon:yes gene_type:complete
MRPPAPGRGCLRRWRRRRPGVEQRVVDHFDDEYQRGDTDDGYPADSVDALDDEDHRGDVDDGDRRDPGDNGSGDRVALR